MTLKKLNTFDVITSSHEDLYKNKRHLTIHGVKHNATVLEYEYWQIPINKQRHCTTI